MAITKAISVSAEFFSMIDSKTISYTGLEEPDVSPRDDIEMDNISFAYPARPNVQVLKGFNARFLSGKTTALVGPSGSGKSTIVALLERWYEMKRSTTDLNPAHDNKPEESSVRVPENGELELNEEAAPNWGVISIGSHDITTTNLKWWRSQIGLVQQEPFLFNDTILNNVAFGLLGTQWENDDAASKKQRVERACKEAFADEFIEQLPEVRIHPGQECRLLTKK